MFNYSIDSKPIITDNEGNVIVDLASSMFADGAIPPKDYQLLQLTDRYVMRPDLVSYMLYGTDQQAEYVLKYTGISNPFTLDEDDVVKIPNETEVYGMMRVNSQPSEADVNSTKEQIRNYFRFVNQDYKSDKSSYDKLDNTQIKSGVVTTQKPAIVPYISDDGRSAVQIKNGRIYFGADSGVPTANNIQDAMNNVLTTLSETNCAFNGMSIADFVRANFKSTENK